MNARTSLMPLLPNCYRKCSISNPQHSLLLLWFPEIEKKFQLHATIPEWQGQDIYIYLSLYIDRSKNNTGFSASLSLPSRQASWARIRLRQAYDWKVKDHRSGFSYIIWRTFPPLSWDVVSSYFEFEKETKSRMNAQ